MVYKKFQDMELSMLGMGAMRLPTVDGDYEKIDEAATAEMVDYAMKQGINYYDTAFGYHGGQSEIVMGKILNQYPRDSYYFATKFPGYDLSNMDKVEEIFEKQLEKTGMEYFDFYLFHCLSDQNIEAYLDPKYGIYDYLMKQKKNGRIKHLGVSVHADYDIFKRFLEAYGEDIEFCQLQINYVDWKFQEANKKVELLKEYGIPVWVMEPLRGGKLATVSEEYESRLQKLRPEEKVPAWAFRYLQSIPEITVILSGMSNFEQIKDNIETFETNEPLNETEMACISEIADEMIEMLLPCTSCRYCTEKCPKGLEIPRLLELHNEYVFSGNKESALEGVMALDEDKRPDACVGCRSCEGVCPQQLKISEAIKDFAEKIR